MSETVLKAAMISKKYKRLIPYALDWKMVYALDEVNIEIGRASCREIVCLYV